MAITKAHLPSMPTIRLLATHAILTPHDWVRRLNGGNCSSTACRACGYRKGPGRRRGQSCGQLNRPRNEMRVTDAAGHPAAAGVVGIEEPLVKERIALGCGDDVGRGEWFARGSIAEQRFGQEPAAGQGPADAFARERLHVAGGISHAEDPL